MQERIGRWGEWKQAACPVGSPWWASRQLASSRCNSLEEEHAFSLTADLVCSCTLSPHRCLILVFVCHLLFVYRVYREVRQICCTVCVKTAIMSAVEIQAGRQVSRQMAKETDRQSVVGIGLTWGSNCIWETRESTYGKMKSGIQMTAQLRSNMGTNKRTLKQISFEGY